MKNILFILLLAMVILPAFADANWQEIQNKNKTIYVDSSTITNQDTQSLYWVKINNSNGYQKMLMKCDCSKNLTGVQKVIVYDDNDKVVKSEDINQELTYVVPDSDAQTAYNYVCDLYKSSQAEKNKKKNAMTPNKLFNTINSINNAGYEMQSIKNNTLNVIKGF